MWPSPVDALPENASAPKKIPSWRRPVSNSCSSVRSAIIDVAVTSAAAAPKLARKFKPGEQAQVEPLVRARRPEAGELQHRPRDHEHREDQSRRS